MADRRARVDDVHEIASAMPHVTANRRSEGQRVYQVGGKSFVFFRTPQPDAEDPETGERYADVIMIWVESESDKLALDPGPGVAVLHHRAGSTGTRRCWCAPAHYDEIGQPGADRAHSGRVAVPGVESSGAAWLAEHGA